MISRVAPKGPRLRGASAPDLPGAEPAIIAITIPGLVTVGPNTTLREHFWADRNRAKRQWREVSWRLVGLGKPDLPLDVLLVRISTGELDGDAVPPALKHVRDAIAAWLGVDDRDPRVTWRYGQEKAKRDSRRLGLARIGMPSQLGVWIEIRARKDMAR